MAYILVIITIIGNTIGLILVKKAVISAGESPKNVSDIVPFLLKAIVNPFTVLAALSVAVGLVAFLLVLTRTGLSRVYPIVGSLSYILVAILGVVLFKESITVWGWLGIILVVCGVFLLSRT